MPEPPDAPLACAKPKPPLGKRVRAWTIVLVIYGGILGMAVAAVPQLRSAFGAGGGWEDRILSAVWGVLLLLPLIFTARYFVRLRLRTGRWRGTPEQRQQDRERRRAKQAARGTASGSAVGCSPSRNSTWSTYVLGWGSYSAMDPTAPLWRRIAGWAVLAGAVLIVLGVTVCGVFAFVAGVSTIQTGGLVMMFLGVVLLIFPAMAVRKLIRGIRDGKLGATRQDLDNIKAQWAAKHACEYARPLRQKVTTALIGFAVIGFLLLWKASRHPKHLSDLWIDAVIYGVPVLYVMWMQFRRPRDASAQDSTPSASTES